MIRKTKISKTYTQRGLKRYQIEIWHDGLDKYQLIKADSKDIVQQKAQMKINQWNEMWQKKQLTAQKQLEREKRALEIQQKNDLAENRTIKAQKILDSLNEILNNALNIDNAINGGLSKYESLFGEYKPKKPKFPEKPVFKLLPPEPDPNDKKYAPKFGIIGGFSKSRREKLKNHAHEQFKRDKEAWERNQLKKINEYDKAMDAYYSKVDKIKKKYSLEIKEWNDKRENYINCDSEAILDYCDLVLSNSEYPNEFPQEYELEYNPETKILIVDYQFPSLESIPTLKEVKYIPSRDEFTEKHLTKSQTNKIYDSILYQITLRTIHELYEADKANALEAVVFNGYVKSIDPAIGQEINSCILSVQAKKDNFSEINLALVEPKACFMKLKGIGSSKLHSLTPIPPIINIKREDKRFIDSYNVVEGIDEGYNLAAMDWEDFEHLIRELFEQAFAEVGGEVKVTQASRDGGIDAVIYDPDPLRGGKIVVQAKRYTNTVGVSAVRDLYGALQHEGANKGILVTTSNYGPDAYEFIKGKPLELMNGNNLLYLLEQQGHKARIDLNEAKKILNDK
ncbi:restriction endonuclease [Methanobacterium oryzae]|uniref:restriction endonuclease n=1 Tax=Methanobacterium oryzae TaxID=69540 RepID=UPI003D19E3ED